MEVKHAQVIRPASLSIGEPWRGAGQALREEVRELELPARPDQRPPSTRCSAPSYRCLFCGRALGAFSRLDFLRERRR